MFKSRVIHNWINEVYGGKNNSHDSMPRRQMMSSVTVLINWPLAAELHIVLAKFLSNCSYVTLLFGTSYVSVLFFWYMKS